MPRLGQRQRGEGDDAPRTVSQSRRNIFRSALAAGAGLLAASASSVPAQAESPGVPKVVYHLADLEKVGFVLGNIRNHIAGMGGPDKVRIALVVHGPALKAFRVNTPNVGVKSDVADANAAGVELHACRHTMEAQKLALADLLPGFVVAEKGAVVKLAELQGQGWAYLRP
jgi:intracellular sulfur oxidation DsrE/DsrF family protein